jgi:DNA-directed RNA polymerase specialized sigma24 family protein
LQQALRARAELLDPSNAEDLAQRTLEVGAALQRRDSLPRGLDELTRILRTLYDARVRLAAGTTPNASATARTRPPSGEPLDGDADPPELRYPALYPDNELIDGWVQSPNQWRRGALAVGAGDTDEAREVYDVLGEALEEVPEPLGELLTLVDVRGLPVADAARALGLDERSATAVLARARNHIRGRLDKYLLGVESELEDGGAR